MRKYTSLFVLLVFFTNTTGPFPQAQADEFHLPAPGTMVNTSAPYIPVVLKGMIVHPQEPFRFDFIVDTGQSGLKADGVRRESMPLIKYFLAGLTIPENDLWVNLSPYEHDRIVPEALGQTALGRDLLSQDYILKQFTASLIYPQKELGKEFWAKVYARAKEKFGSTQIPVNTFNKVWILPDQAAVFEHDNKVYVTRATLKVMLDEDYLALKKNNSHQTLSSPNVFIGDPDKAHSLASQVVREIVLPEITKEVNTGKNFALLRQMYYSLILAKWFKETLKDSLFAKLYRDKNKIKGINLDDLTIKDRIYAQYLKAYKKGVFNYIKEDTDAGGQTIPRKYFSGGMAMDITVAHDSAMTETLAGDLFRIDVNVARVGDRAMTAEEQAERLAVAARSITHGAVFFVNMIQPLQALRDEITKLELHNPEAFKIFEDLERSIERFPLINPEQVDELLKRNPGDPEAYRKVINDIMELENQFDKEEIIFEGLVQRLKKELDHPAFFEKGFQVDVWAQHMLQESHNFRLKLQSRINLWKGIRGQDEFSLDDLLQELKKINNIESFSHPSLGYIFIDNKVEGQGRFLGNRFTLLIAIYNLISNALDAVKTNERNQVKVQIDSDSNSKGNIIIQVADKGPGLDPKFLEINSVTGRQNIFNLDNTTKEGGTGLGTTEVWYAVKDMGGKIVAANQPEGGAIFTMHFPMAGTQSNLEDRTIPRDIALRSGDEAMNTGSRSPSKDRNMAQLSTKPHIFAGPAMREDNKTGGIDLNNINVARQGQAIGFNVDSAQAAQMLKEGVEGFVPVIINVQPTDLKSQG